LPRRPCQATPPGNIACDEECEQEDVSNEESKQGDASTDPKKKVQLGILSFYAKKPKKRGRGRPWKVQMVLPLPPTPQPCAKKKKVEETKTGSRKYANYSNPAVAAAWQEALEFYISNGKFQTHRDALLTNQPIIHIPKRTIVRDAAKLLGSNKLANNKFPPA
jgi:hypothetical protein